MAYTSRFPRWTRWEVITTWSRCRWLTAQITLATTPGAKTAQLIQFDTVTADINKTRNVGAELLGLNQEGEESACFVFGFHKAVTALFPRLGSNCDLTLSWEKSIKIPCLVNFKNVLCGAKVQFYTFLATRHSTLNTFHLCFTFIFKQVQYLFFSVDILTSKLITYLWNKDTSLYFPFRTLQCELFCLKTFI